MPFTPADVQAGQAIYTRRMLGWYDLLVLRLTCRFVWKCPAARILALYDAHVSANHVEVGVGTGYFLDRCRFPAPDPQIALVDLNANCLEAASQRIARYEPQTFVRNALEPFDQDGRTFDSAGLNFVLHCLPGNLREKGVVFDHLRAVMNPGATIFGATLLTHGVQRNPAARLVMSIYNGKRVFCNTADSLDELREQLQQRFTDCRIETSGSAAIFSARRG